MVRTRTIRKSFAARKGCRRRQALNKGYLRRKIDLLSEEYEVELSS